MEFLTYIRVVAVFATLYWALPTWARGRLGESFAGWAGSFVRFCFFTEVTVVLLGMIGLALPGALLPLALLWFGIDAAQRTPELLVGPNSRREWLIRQLTALRHAADLRYAWGRIASQQRRVRNALTWMTLPAFPLVVKAFFPIHNARLSDMDDYSRSISLSVLNNGHSWVPDLSVPLLLPLQYLAAVAAPRAVALSEPLFAALLIAAIGFVVFQLRGCRPAAITAMGSAVFLMLSPVMDGVDDLARSELAVTFILLAIGLRSTSRLEALLSAVLGIAVGFLPGHFAQSLQVLIPYMAAVLLGIGVAEFRIQPCVTVRRLAGIGLTAALVAAFVYVARQQPDGPIQYEAAAKVARQLALEQPRNTWALVSTTQELPYVYGNGWHVEIAGFVRDVQAAQVARPSYQFPFPVRDVYFLVETRPLQPQSFPTSGAAVLQARLSPTASSAYSTPLERATLEFQLAELLAIYGQHHDDLKVVWRTDDLMLFHAPGLLAGR